MNIFEALSRGKGAVNEENISSFLAFLFDSGETHGLGVAFLDEFLNLLGEKIAVDLKNLKLAEILLEKSAQNESESRIDICLIFTKNGEEKYKICIENKINFGAKNDEQLQKEYDAIAKYRNENKGDFKIIFVYLTPENDAFGEIFETLKIDENDFKRHIFWGEILGAIGAIFEQENNFKIAPINEYAKHTIKAFCHYILQKMSREFEFKLGDEIYTLKAFNDGGFEVWENGEKVVAKPILREFCEIYGIDFLDRRQDIRGDTTRDLGKKVVEFLEKNKKI